MRGFLKLRRGELDIWRTLLSEFEIPKIRAESSRGFGVNSKNNGVSYNTDL